MKSGASSLVCAFGSKWGAKGCGPCLKCLREAQRMDEAFDRGVFFGLHDQTGRKPNERKVSHA